MAFYSAPFTFNFGTTLIQVDEGTTEFDVIELYAAVRDAQASEEGVLYGRIAAGSGLVALGGGVQVGITVELLESWQLRFAEGAYIARVTAGNLVGGPGGDPIAYSAGVQTLLIQSAASTVVTMGDAAHATTQAAVAAVPAAVRTELATELARMDVAISTRLAAADYTEPPTAASNADTLLGRNLAGSADGGRTVRDALRASRNKTAISGSTLTVYEEDDTTPAWTASVSTEARDALQSIDPA